MTCNAQGPRPFTPCRAMETLLDKFKKEQGGLRRSRSVRASLRLIGNRWRTKDEDTSDDIEGIKRDNVVVKQIFNAEKDFTVAYTGIDGTYKAKTPNMAKRKPEPVKIRRKSGDIDLILKPQRHRRIEKTKFSDLFNKKPKSISAKELLVPEKIPPKAAAILHINSPEKDKMKRKLKGMGKSESANLITDMGSRRRTRRGSESDMTCGTQPRGCVNQAFVYSTPPKDRKQIPLSPSAYLSTYIVFILFLYQIYCLRNIDSPDLMLKGYQIRRHNWDTARIGVCVT